MIRHIVSWKVAGEGAAKETAIAEIVAALGTLPALIPEILAFEVGRNVLPDETNFDLVLVAEYADLDALRTYIAHPEHLEVAGVIRARVSARANVDIEV